MDKSLKNHIMVYAGARDKKDNGHFSLIDKKIIINK